MFEFLKHAPLAKEKIETSKSTAEILRTAMAKVTNRYAMRIALFGATIFSLAGCKESAEEKLITDQRLAIEWEAKLLQNDIQQLIELAENNQLYNDLPAEIDTAIITEYTNCLLEDVAERVDNEVKKELKELLLETNGTSLNILSKLPEEKKNLLAEAALEDKLYDGEIKDKDNLLYENGTYTIVDSELENDNLIKRTSELEEKLESVDNLGDALADALLTHYAKKFPEISEKFTEQISVERKLEILSEQTGNTEFSKLVSEYNLANNDLDTLKSEYYSLSERLDSARTSIEYQQVRASGPDQDPDLIKFDAYQDAQRKILEEGRDNIIKNPKILVNYLVKRITMGSYRVEKMLNNFFKNDSTEKKLAEIAKACDIDIHNSSEYQDYLQSSAEQGFVDEDATSKKYGITGKNLEVYVDTLTNQNLRKLPVAYEREVLVLKIKNMEEKINLISKKLTEAVTRIITSE